MSEIVNEIVEFAMPIMIFGNLTVLIIFTAKNGKYLTEIRDLLKDRKGD